MLRAQDPKEIGSVWTEQMEVWHSYANCLREQSEKLLNLWMSQAFEYQREGQRFFSEWLKSMHHGGTDLQQIWESQKRESTPGARARPGEEHERREGREQFGRREGSERYGEA
jgi:hypothetical protein